MSDALSAVSQHSVAISDLVSRPRPRPLQRHFIVVPWTSLNSSLKWLVHCSSSSCCSCVPRCVCIALSLSLFISRSPSACALLSRASPSGCRECIHCTAHSAQLAHSTDRFCPKRIQLAALQNAFAIKSQNVPPNASNN